MCFQMSIVDMNKRKYPRTAMLKYAGGLSYIPRWGSGVLQVLLSLLTHMSEHPVAVLLQPVGSQESMRRGVPVTCLDFLYYTLRWRLW
jgi:hypothetical protein